MTYRVFGIHQLEETSKAPDSAPFLQRMESALNQMEREGFTLVHVYHDTEGGVQEPDWFIFHQEGMPPQRWEL